MKRLFAYLKKYPKESILAPLFKMLEACFDLLVPLVVVYMLQGVSGGDKKIVFEAFIQLIVMAIIGLLCCVVAQYYSAKVATSTSSYLNKELFSHINKLSYADLDKLGTAKIITYLTSDTLMIQNGINLFLRLFLRSPFIVIGCFIMAMRINLKLSMIFLGLIILLTIVVVVVMRLSNPLNKKNQNNLESLTTIAKENLSGVRVIRAFNNQENEIRDFKNANDVLVKGQLNVGRISALLNPLTYVLVNLSIVLILYFGSKQVSSSLLINTQVIALVNYMSQILVELVKLANLIISISKSIASIERVEDVLALKPSMEYGEEKIDRNNDNAIIFDKVCFKYPSSDLESLEDINLTIKNKQTIGIIGSTGSGKTTLISLIARMYDASKGEVYLFGKNIKEYAKEDLYKNIAVVPQKAQLISGTIRSNLTMDLKDVKDDDIFEACKIAQAYDFVKKKGLDSVVEQQGRNFSGGQKQRLTIARALLSKPAILILDDSSSALDYATDYQLRSSLKKLDMTTIIVSQRTNSIQDADQIVVLEEGRIVGLGKHDDLLNNCAVYKEIYDSQYQKGEENE